MTSRTASPLRLRTSSPGRIPVEAAGEPGATATTRAGGMAEVYGRGRPPESAGVSRAILSIGARRTSAPGATARLLRRRRDGDQGVGVDGPCLRAARVLLPRDRPQPARRRRTRLRERRAVG